MGLVDLDRNSKAQEESYTTMQFTMNPETCTPKNDIIFGVPKERLPELELTPGSLFSAIIHLKTDQLTWILFSIVICRL